MREAFIGAGIVLTLGAIAIVLIDRHLRGVPKRYRYR